MPRSRKIFLTGFMGSGKTTAGKKLADELGFSFADADQLIEKEQGKRIGRIFEESGEEHFRSLEASAIRSFEKSRDIVISVGGGAPCFPGNMEYMKRNGIVIYLSLSPEQLYERLEGEQGNRPLIKDFAGNDLLRFITVKLAEREPFYLQAHLIVDGFHPDIKLIAGKIRQIWERG